MTKKHKKNEVCLSIYADSKNSDLLIRVVDNESLKVIKVISENDLLDIKDEINEMVDKLIIPP
ncbi:MAG: hypothetical protein A3D21_04265 [Nitrospirae bacterium RIFCSPHIGHO2_02_FULL_42_12]|nr:MAG: hypothetical protein A3D21_04265 [Nitrospirae bacterium RIFCSPHIGHO2_02_FULL_42_12]